MTRSTSALVLVLLLVAGRPPLRAQSSFPPGLNYTSPTTGWAHLADVQLKTVPCGRDSKDFTVAVPFPQFLDPQHTVGSIPGLDLFVSTSIGRVTAALVSLAGANAVVRLTAQGEGLSVSKTCTPPGQPPTTCTECVGAIEPFVVAHVLAYYRVAQPAELDTIAAQLRGAAAPASQPPVTMAATQRFPVASPDFRLAVSLPPVQAAMSGFQWLQYGDTIRLGEFGCGDPRFTVQLYRPPSFAMSGWLANLGGLIGAQGTTLSVAAAAHAEIHGNCFGSNNRVDASARLSAVVSSLTSSQPAKIAGTAHIGAIAGLINRTFPVEFPLPLPATALSAIPIDLKPVADAILDFGTLSGGVWSSSGAHKDIPVSVSVSSFGGTPANNTTLVVDASIGPMQYVPLGNYNEARQFFESDLPLWNGRTVGATLRETLFGSARPGHRPVGLLGALLPIRVKGVARGKFLFWPIKKDFEVVLDIASVEMPADLGGDPAKASIKVTLGSTYARIANGRPKVSATDPVRNVEGSMTLDNIRYEADAIRFRVADFRLNIRTTHFLIPVKLPGAALERALNGGVIPLTGSTETAVDLPVCLFTGYEKFKSPRGVCAAEQLIGWLGHTAGKRRLGIRIDPTTLQLRPASFELKGQKWRGIQTSITVTLQ